MRESSQYKAFHVDADGLHYKGSRYTLDEIAHLRFANVTTSHSVNFVEIGKSQGAGMWIELQDRSIIKLSFDEARLLNIFNSRTKADIKNLGDIYVYLAERTFAHRLQHYMGQVVSKGYFEYDGCKFFPSKKITFRRKEFPLQSSTFLKGSGYIELRPKPWTIFHRILREFTFTKIPQFSYIRDADVIFHILERDFGLRWE